LAVSGIHCGAELREMLQGSLPWAGRGVPPVVVGLELHDTKLKMRALVFVAVKRHTYPESWCPLAIHHGARLPALSVCAARFARDRRDTAELAVDSSALPD
jgi:hypothetical protein